MDETFALLLPQSDLLGRLVIDRNSIEAIGRVEQLWVDLKLRQVVALACRTGTLGRRRILGWSQIERVGADAILVKALEQLEIEPPAGCSNLLHHEVWTDVGAKVGVLKDYRLNTKTGEIYDYWLIARGGQGIAEGTYRLSANHVLSLGNQRLIIREAALDQLEQQPGWEQKLTQVKATLQQDYSRVQKNLTAALQDSEAIATHLQEKTQARLSTVSEQVQQTAAQVKQQATETISTVTNQLQEKAQPLKEQLQEHLTGIQGRWQKLKQRHRRP